MSGAGMWDWGLIAEVLVFLQEWPGDFLSTGVAFFLSGLGLIGVFRVELSLTGSKVEGEEESEVIIGESSEEEMWVGDLVAEVLVSLRDQRDYLFGHGALFCSYDFGLVEGFWSGLSLTGSYMERREESEVDGGNFSEERM